MVRTSTKMKRILRKEYPNAKFKVRKESSSMHKAFDVYTNLLVEVDFQRFRDLEKKMQSDGLDEEAYAELKRINDVREMNREIKGKIKHELLSKFWNVDQDERTGEILGGGNTYLSVKPWKWSKHLT